MSLQLSHHDGPPAFLLEYVDPKTSQITERITAIAGAGGGKVGLQSFVAIDDVRRDLLDVTRVQERVRRVDREIGQGSMGFDERGFTGGEDEIGNAFAAGDHRLEKGVNDFRSHMGLVFGRAICGCHSN